MNILYKKPNRKIINYSYLKQGMDFRAAVSDIQLGLEYFSILTLNQIFPSGWEIHNSRMDLGSSIIQTNILGYQEIRDNRIYSYFDLFVSQTKQFVIFLNAAFLGICYLSRTSCEAMYDNRIQTVRTGQWLMVSEIK